MIKKKTITTFILVACYLTNIAQTTNTAPLPAGETITGNHLHAGCGNEVWTDATSLYFNYRGAAATTYFWNLGGGSGKPIMTLLNNGNVGIGTTNLSEKLTIGGGHGDTKLRLSSTGNGSDQPANLSLWASEPGWTYYGTGIGYNVNGSPYYGRIDNTRGSSYLRFLPGETKFEFQNTAGAYINAVTLKESGNVGIGTTNPTYKLDLLGTIRAKEVLVNLDGGADFVFEKDYKLPTIEHVATYVQENKHLPDIPSANDMVKNGVSMGDMQVKLLQKVEELTLYVIELKKEINQLKQGNK